MSMMVIYLFFIALVVLFAIISPFVPALMELWKPKDNTPLKIDADYTINPFENGDRLHKLIQSCVYGENNDNNSSEIKDIQKNIIVYNGNVRSFQEERSFLPVYVTGSIDTDGKNTFEILLCEKEVHFHDNISIKNWIDCRGNCMYFGKSCQLGYSCICKGKMYIKENSTFETLYANTIFFGDKPDETDPLIETVIKNDIIQKNDVKVKEHCMVIGCIKSYRRVILYPNSVIQGDVFAEGDIIVGENCVVQGSLFSQGHISVGINSVIGIKDHVRSVVAKQITFSNANVVYGKVSCQKGYVIPKNI